MGHPVEKCDKAGDGKPDCQISEQGPALRAKAGNQSAGYEDEVSGEKCNGLQ